MIVIREWEKDRKKKSEREIYEGWKQFSKQKKKYLIKKNIRKNCNGVLFDVYLINKQYNNTWKFKKKGRKNSSNAFQYPTNIIIYEEH